MASWVDFRLLAGHLSTGPWVQGRQKHRTFSENRFFSAKKTAGRKWQKKTKKHRPYCTRAGRHGPCFVLLLTCISELITYAFLFWIDLNARGTLAQPAPTPAKPTLKHELGLNVLTPPEVVAAAAASSRLA
jgi:hypothetical protein